MIIAIAKDDLFEFLKKNETFNGCARVLMAKDRAALDEYLYEWRYTGLAVDLNDYVILEIKELPL